jgi:arylsulfatase A-like enzyme
VFLALAATVASIALSATVLPLAGPQTSETSLAIVAVGVASLALLSIAEWRADESVPQESGSLDRSFADLMACLAAAAGSSLVQTAASVAVGTAVTAPAVLHGVRLHLLLGAGTFLCLTTVRAVADLAPVYRVRIERVFTGACLGSALTAFLFFVPLASISIRGLTGVAFSTAIGLTIALAIIARRGSATSASIDGIEGALSSVSPRFGKHWWGMAIWAAMLAGVAAAFATAARTGDWNFVMARTGALLVWLLMLAGAVRATRRVPAGGTALSFAAVAALLAAHVALPAAAPAMVASAEPGTKWIAEAFEPPAAPVAGEELVALLHAHTNIPRGTRVEPVDVSLSPLAGEPAAQPPHVFVFVVDSLRRDYLSPYNPAVTFTPSIDALAKDSLVFRNAFTQYGATGLSVPSLWVGGPVLHKQYVTPFAPMNSLAKLLEHERYTQWIAMDNIMDVILPASDRRDPLVQRNGVRDFRLCRTLSEVRDRLRDRTSDDPVFVYALPQDVHVSVLAHEGGTAVDERRYDGFHAPVASRVSRLDACLGEFVADLKSSGLYERSVIVLTSDHGDSLGEEGRMGHAYSLHPEVVRVPLIVHVPPALRSQWSWDEERVAYTTDVTPTLYRLLGHEPHAPAAFFGESLARPAGSAARAPRDRMIAASYGAVYGALLNGGTQYYVFDAIAMRELAFSIDSGPEPGRAIPVTVDIQQRGLDVIRDTVGGISRFYRYPRPATDTE